MSSQSSRAKLRVCAVSYLNTAPLVWGLLHGPQQGAFDLSFEVPSKCADLLLEGNVDIGLVPVVELLRGDFATVPGIGISSNGPVRSILLLSKCDPREIRVLAADSSSRTSVVLAKMILQQRYGCRPRMAPHAPDVAEMLNGADACLVIGDPALRFDLTAAVGLHVLDLGEEWTKLTGLPMVFAVWAGPKAAITAEATATLHASAQYGAERIEEIVATEAPKRNITPELARQYLTRHIKCKLQADADAGLARFLKEAAALDERGAGSAPRFRV